MFNFLKNVSVIVSIVIATTMPLLSEAATLQTKLAALEATTDGRLGLSAINTANNTHLSYRADERFPMGCTSKVIGVAAILQQSVSNNTLLQEHVSIKKSDLAGWSPITSKHLADGMSVLELCSAAIEYSDNTAMDLLLKKLGGVGGVNAFARNLGDNTFRLDRGYPDEATSIPGDLRDTTTPSAMLNSQQQVVLGDTLTIPLRDQLQSWMKNNTLGKARIRAGVPQQWVVADKTGTGSGYGATNDAAIIWPPRCPPLVLVIFYTGNKKEDIEREDVLAAATRIVLDEFAQSDKCFTS